MLDNNVRNSKYLLRGLVNSFIAALAVSAVCMSLTVLAEQNAPKMSVLAPDFELYDQAKQSHQLSDYRGQWVVMYFYPRDDTRGCTIEAGAFNNALEQLEALNTQVFGISVDNVASHKAFADKLKLKFSLLADTDYQVSRAYGVLKEIGPIKYAKRETFIIDPQGQIAHHFEQVDPDTHVPMVLEALARLQKASK